ncbi:MAG: glycosyltransferase family 2 protein [Fibrobacteres bacterium]|nr:glycosyltransferase family 2 protein [Fibrobacterota bacterium]
MLNNRKICVVLPAYNAAQTLERTYAEIPIDIVDSVILVDDHSADNTFDIAGKLNILRYRHDKNLGYGANQKTCYTHALEQDADIIVMLHPDYQYTPKLIPALCSLIAYGSYDAVFGSRILGKGALKGGMPVYKYIGNRILTFLQNIMIGQKMSEYHTGFRAFSREVLEKIDFNKNSNGFVFDNEFAVQLFENGFRVGEVSCPTSYFKEASSIGFMNGLTYAIGCMRVSLNYMLRKKVK